MKKPTAKRGRPKTMKAGRPVEVYLDPPTIKKAKKVGAGSTSAGIRIAVAAYPEDGPPCPVLSGKP